MNIQTKKIFNSYTCFGYFLNTNQMSYGFIYIFIKGALYSFGEQVLISRETSSLIFYLGLNNLNKQTIFVFMTE